MNFILIIVVMNIMNPSDPSVLAHKVFPTEVACETMGKQLLKNNPPPENLRVASFCVQEDDLVGIKNRT